MNTNILKILADGTEVPATDARTDHVAILFQDSGWMVACKALSTPEGEPLDTADEVDAAASELSLLGFNDWINAPLAEVWQPHVLNYRYEPAVDINLFPDLPMNDWYWTGTAAPWSAESAFGVDLYSGDVSSGHRGNGGFGLACRRARQ